MGSSNLAYFCEPNLRTELYGSVCGTKRTSRQFSVSFPLGGKADIRKCSGNVR